MSEAKVIDLRRAGKGYKSIARSLGISYQRVAHICRKNGIGGFVAGKCDRLTEEKVAEIVSMSGFDYVGGYEMAKKPITVKCRKCGRTFDRQFHIFRDVVNGTWQFKNECPCCREILQKQREQLRLSRKEREAQKKAQLRAERESREISEELAKRLAIHVCKNCGAEFCCGVTGYNSVTYCSERCQKRYYNRKASEKRHRTLMAREHDNDISLEKLFKKEGGICYLCGRQCDWSDGETKDGTFIAGQSYPSIDHVIPVSKGGTHTWSNVRLACRECNTLKRDSL